MRAVPAALALLALVSLLGCRSVAWHEGGSGELWRGASLRRGDLASVAAVHEADAAAIYLEFEDVCAAMRQAGVVPPPPPLLLVVAADQELVFGTPEVTFERLAKRTRRGSKGSKVDEPDESPAPAEEVPEALLAAMARAAAGAVELDDERLALPAAWRAANEWAMVVPTAGSREIAADAVLDFALAQEEVSFAQRLLMMPLMPWLRGMTRDAIDVAVKRAWLEAVLGAARHRGPVPEDALGKCLRALGLPEQGLGRVGPQLEGLGAVRGNDG